MADYGITPDGFVRKPVDVILGETNDGQREAFGDEWDTSPASPDGIINGIDAAQKAELWEVAEGVYAAFDPDKATRSDLDALCALVGVLRRPATRSTAPGTVSLDGGTSVAARDLVVSVSGNPSARFRNRDAFENAGGSPDDIAVVWEAVETGPVVANNGTLTEIDTPITGVNAVTNTADATLGSHIEADAALRIRREEEIRRQGGSTLAAVRAVLLGLDGVTQVEAYENDSDSVVDGMPPHSFEMVVFGGDDQDIAEALFASKPAGIQAWGTTEEQVTDARGHEHTVRFTRPVEVDVYLELDVTVDASSYPADGDDQVAQGVALYGNAAFGIGASVILSRFYGPAFDVSGVRDVTAIRAGLAPMPSGTANIAIGPREIARFDTSRITVSP